jgi:hypothetical protein
VRRLDRRRKIALDVCPAQGRRSHSFAGIIPRRNKA